MYVCGAIDSTQFEQQPEQEFEDAEQQKQFEEGKCPLIMLFVPNESQIIHLYIYCMHVSIIRWNPIKDIYMALVLAK